MLLGLFGSDIVRIGIMPKNYTAVRNFYLRAAGNPTNPYFSTAGLSNMGKAAGWQFFLWPMHEECKGHSRSKKQEIPVRSDSNADIDLNIILTT